MCEVVLHLDSTTPVNEDLVYEDLTKARCESVEYAFDDMLNKTTSDCEVVAYVVPKVVCEEHANFNVFITAPSSVKGDEESTYAGDEPAFTESDSLPVNCSTDAI